MAMPHPHCHIVASNDQFSNFMATDIAFGHVKQLLPKCCHAIAGKDIASNDKLCGNVESDIAGDFVATPSPLGFGRKIDFQKGLPFCFIKYLECDLFS